MKNLYIRTSSKDLTPVAPLISKRKAHMDRIRTSLQTVPLLQQNLVLNLKRLSHNSKNTNEKSDSDSANQSPEKDNGLSVESYELFEQKYEFLEKLGEGTNGVVRKCKRKATGEEFAVKSFSFEDQHLPGLKSNFLIMKRLKHPNVIKYQALYIDMRKRTGWLVMQLVRAGGLLKAGLKSEADIKNVIFQIMETLSYLHRQDMVHRDIKPDNILYDPQTKKIKLVDFGISKRFRRRGALIDMWTITGALFYRAPEMFAGGYREGVDIWATGILLYKIITGKTPFECQYLHETIQNIRGAQIQFPSEFQNYSSDLKNFTLRLLSRNPEKRPNSCLCLKDSWFSDLYSSLLSKKCSVNDKSLQNNNGNVKCRVKANISLDCQADEFQSPSTTLGSLMSVRPYVKMVNGQEYHCIDSEWK